jgi:hypothetical protein
MEDTHDSLKIILQRQFFEAVARAAFVKYASGVDAEELTSLALKLDHVFQNNFTNLAVKNKSKSVEDEKAFRLADKVFEEYYDDLTKIFDFFSHKAGTIYNGRKDVTITVDELLELLKKANLIDGKTNDI